METITKELFESAVPAFRSAGNETFRAMRPHLEAAEEEIKDETGADDAPGMAAYVCVRGAQMAVPELDLVLTANGFGVVSNQNVAPASKERVAALGLALKERRTALHDALWRKLVATQGADFNPGYISALAWLPSHLSAHGVKRPDGGRLCLEEYSALAVERAIAEEQAAFMLGTTLYNALVENERTAGGDWLAKICLNRARNFIASVVTRDENFAHSAALSLVSFLNTHGAALPGYQGSAAAANLRTPRYENRKEDKTFFFG